MKKHVESGARKKDVVAKYGIPVIGHHIKKNRKTVIIAIESGGTSGSPKRLKKPTYSNVQGALSEWFR